MERHRCHCCNATTELLFAGTAMEVYGVDGPDVYTCVRCDQFLGASDERDYSRRSSRYKQDQHDWQKEGF